MLPNMHDIRIPWGTILPPSQILHVKRSYPDLIQFDKKTNDKRGRLTGCKSDSWLLGCGFLQQRASFDFLDYLNNFDKTPNTYRKRSSTI